MAKPADHQARLDVLLKHLIPSRPMRICDVGANPLGAPPYAALRDQGVAEIYGFEPHPEAYQALVGTKSSCEHYFPVAIGLGGTRTLYVHPKSGFTSLFPLDDAALTRVGKQKWKDTRRPIQRLDVTTVPLDDVAGLPQIDVLKMDLQGAESEVLQTGQARLADAIAVVTEVRFHRMYTGEALFGDLDVLLRRMGFSLQKFLFTKSVMMPHAHEGRVHRAAMTSQLLDGDAAYLPTNLEAEQFSDDQLCFFAFVADTMLDSPDVALWALGILEERGRIATDAAHDYIGTLLPRQRARPARPDASRT